MCKKSFSVDFFLEILAEQQIFEKNPIFDFVLGNSQNNNFEEDVLILKNKIKHLIPGWILSIHLENIPPLVVNCEIEIVKREIFFKCQKTEFEIDLRRII